MACRDSIRTQNLTFNDVMCWKIAQSIAERVTRPKKGDETPLKDSERETNPYACIPANGVHDSYFSRKCSFMKFIKDVEKPYSEIQ